MSKTSWRRWVVLAAAPAVFLFHASPGRATTLTLADGGSTTIDAASPDVEVRDGPGVAPTTLNVVDGAVIGTSDIVEDQSVGVFEHSILQMSGGELEGNLNVMGESLATISGGAVAGETHVEGAARLNLSDVGTLEGDVAVEGAGRFVMTGGTIEGEIAFDDDAMGDFSGGTLEDTLAAEGNAVIDVHFVTTEDNVEAADDAVVNFFNGEVGGSVEAEGNAVINIHGGAFPAVFSDGEAVVATGAAIHITGGVFGEAGVNDGGFVRAGLNGLLNFTGAIIDGADNGTAPTAVISAALNGEVNVSGVDFSDLVLEGGNNGVVNVVDVTAGDVTVSTIAGGEVNILGGEFDVLKVLAELDSFVNIRGGDFLDADLDAQSRSVIRIRGSSFTVNGQPAEFGNILQVAGLVEGTLADGSAFAATFRRQFNPVANAAQIVLVAVPEPCVAVLAVGAILGLAWLRTTALDRRANAIGMKR
jgi:hypothetical protein